MDMRFTLNAARSAAQLIAEQALERLNRAHRTTPPRPQDAAAATAELERLADDARGCLRAVARDAERRTACLRSVAQVLRDGHGAVQNADLAGAMERDLQAITLARKAGLVGGEAQALADHIDRELDSAMPMHHALA